MPSDAAYWLVSAPLKNGDDNDLFRSIKTVVTDNTLIGGLELPSLKVSSGQLGGDVLVMGLPDDRSADTMILWFTIGYIWSHSLSPSSSSSLSLLNHAGIRPVPTFYPLTTGRDALLPPDTQRRLAQTRRLLHLGRRQATRYHQIPRSRFRPIPIRIPIPIPISIRQGQTRILRPYQRPPPNSIPHPAFRSSSRVDLGCREVGPRWKGDRCRRGARQGDEQYRFDPEAKGPGV